MNKILRIRLDITYLLKVTNKPTVFNCAKNLSSCFLSQI